jgi:regulator of extracellular matrix RemA (YlzA/DUF370 family)
MTKTERFIAFTSLKSANNKIYMITEAKLQVTNIDSHILRREKMLIMKRQANIVSNNVFLLSDVWCSSQ